MSRTEVNRKFLFQSIFSALAVLVLAVLVHGVEPVPARFHRPPKDLPPDAVTQDWPSFLGPTSDGVSKESNLLDRFPQGGPSLVWEMETGTGYASPVVVGNRLIFYHRVADEERVECRNPLTGEPLWSFEYPSNYKDRYGFNNGPRATPVVDGQRVFTHGALGVLHALDLATGKVIWTRNTSVEFKVPQEFFGLGSTPLVEGDLLIVNVGAPGGPCVVAFDKKTGKTVWKAGKQWGPSYASVVPADIGGRRRILVFAGGDSDPATGGLLVLDPMTGKIDARFSFRSKSPISVNAASPLVIDERIFLSTSYKTGCVMLELGDSTSCDVVWKNNSLRSHFATPVYKDGFLYGFDEPNKSQTALVCVDAKTGKRVWRAQPNWTEASAGKGEGGREPQPVYLEAGGVRLVDGKLLCLGSQGHLIWVEASPKGYNELSHIRLFAARETYVPPVVSHGLLYVTQNKPDTKAGTPTRLLCYDLRGR